MSVFRIYSEVIGNILLISLVSLSITFGLFFLSSAAGGNDLKGGYAVLAADASIEDNFLYEILSNNSGGSQFFAGKPVSESAQWVLLDNFGSLETVPLDMYFSRILPFDPRNDGYAAKLRDVFIEDDKRFIFIPLSSVNWNTKALNSQFAGIMGEIPFSVEYYGVVKPVWLFFVSYAASSLVLLIVLLIRSKTFRKDICIIPIIPVIAALAFYGAGGIAVAALFFGIFFFIKEPLNELIFPEKSLIKRKAKKNLMEKIKPYKLDFFFLLFFAFAAGLICIVHRLNPMFLLTVFAASFAVLLLSLARIPAVLQMQRRRFAPVNIIKRRSLDFSFSIFMMPFAAAAFLLLFLAPLFSGGYASNGKFETIIEESDYHSHLIYQATFSTRQLGSSSSSFPSYKFDEDGLPSLQNENNIAPELIIASFPDFPLKNLMEFFTDINSGRIVNETSGNISIKEKMSLFVLLFFIFPVFLFKRKNNYTPEENISYIKKFYVRLRIRGVNRSRGKQWAENRFQKDA